MHTKRSLDMIPDANSQMVFKKTPNSYPIRDGWVKIISDHCRLPLPSAVEYPSHIPGRIFSGDFYVPKSDEIIIEGYSYGTFKTRSGITISLWNYRVSGIDSRGEFFSYNGNWMSLKKQMRSQGMDKTLLDGTKELAALVRVGHAIRLGMNLINEVPQPEANQSADSRPPRLRK
ncbi:hypothetical protein [Duganella callida]|uniref:Uncharacterized protein n=1 Tax=Duganella callida TaxID=2561932 RepID=A0A4Y9SD33_9BURK|nr:hypothetical protein [Duganella callida]TFW18667.1 hypothetical protein E4L98_17625 [Duganella callida]